MKHESIKLKELQDWYTEQKVFYARCPTKRLFFCLSGSWAIDVRKGNEWVVVHQGMQLFSAVEYYNDLP